MIERPDVLFDNIINIFNELAKIEDEQRELQKEIESYKPDSPKRAELLIKLNEVENRRIKVAREYQIAKFNIERTWMKIEVSKRNIYIPSN